MRSVLSQCRPRMSRTVRVCALLALCVFVLDKLDVQHVLYNTAREGGIRVVGLVKETRGNVTRGGKADATHVHGARAQNARLNLTRAGGKHAGGKESGTRARGGKLITGTPVNNTRVYSTRVDNIRANRKKDAKDVVPDANTTHSPQAEDGDTMFERVCVASKISPRRNSSSMATPEARKARGPRFPTTLLIIVMKHPNWKVVPYVDALYSHDFPHRVYCSVQGGKEEDEHSRLRAAGYRTHVYQVPKNKPVKYLSGYLNYGCTVDVLREVLSLHPGSRSLPYSGILVVPDDIVFLPSRLVHMDRNKVWTVEAITAEINSGLTCEGWFLPKCAGGAGCEGVPAPAEVCEATRTYWMWFQPLRLDILAAHREIESHAQNNTRPYKQCIRSVLQTTGGSNRTHFGYADFYYIPKHKIQDFVTLTSVFLQHMAVVDAAVPYTLSCISDGPVQTLPGVVQEKTKTRLPPWENLHELYDNKDMLFYHEVKWFELVRGRKAYKQVYCNVTETLRALW